MELPEIARQLKDQSVHYLELLKPRKCFTEIKEEDGKITFAVFANYYCVGVSYPLLKRKFTIEDYSSTVNTSAYKIEVGSLSDQSKDLIIHKEDNAGLMMYLAKVVERVIMMSVNTDHHLFLA